MVSHCLFQWPLSDFIHATETDTFSFAITTRIPTGELQTAVDALCYPILGTLLDRLPAPSKTATKKVKGAAPVENDEYYDDDQYDSAAGDDREPDKEDGDGGHSSSGDDDDSASSEYDEDDEEEAEEDDEEKAEDSNADADADDYY